MHLKMGHVAVASEVCAPPHHHNNNNNDLFIYIRSRLDLGARRVQVYTRVLSGSAFYMRSRRILHTISAHFTYDLGARRVQVYTRVLSGAAGELSQREREVALRKIAICATMGPG